MVPRLVQFYFRFAAGPVQQSKQVTQLSIYIALPLRYYSVPSQQGRNRNMASSSDTVPQARVILQQCMSARLMVQPPTQETEAQYVQIGRGLIIYVCFLKGATESVLDKMVKSILGAKLSESENGKLVSVLDLPGDVLIIPQATLGGNLKGKSMQYHKNINKEEGLNLYTKFTLLCQEVMEQSDKCREKQTTVKFGTYGNRQVFSTDTNGPYSHFLEF